MGILGGGIKTPASRNKNAISTDRSTMAAFACGDIALYKVPKWETRKGKENRKNNIRNKDSNRVTIKHKYSEHQPKEKPVEASPCINSGTPKAADDRNRWKKYQIRKFDEVHRKGERKAGIIFRRVIALEEFAHYEELRNGAKHYHHPWKKYLVFTQGIIEFF